MSKNLLAGYFTNSADLTNTNSSSVDIGGRSFFDIISECKDFSTNASFFIKKFRKLK